MIVDAPNFGAFGGDRPIESGPPRGGSSNRGGSRGGGVSDEN